MTQSVGFVGLGNMGSRMSQRLVASGLEVVGFDPARDGDSGIVSRWTSSLATLGQLPVILLSLPEASVVNAVMRGGPDQPGLADQLAKGSIVVDLTTSDPALSTSLAGHARRNGAEYLDVGISGGADGADRGVLTLMVGGSAAALETVTPILDVLSATIVHMGPSGAGHATKVLNNFLNAVNLSASAEVLIAARAGGLDVEKVLDVINSSSGSNWATQHRFPHIIAGDYLEGGLSSKLMMKDIQLYLDYAGKVGVPSLHASGPVAAFGSAIQRGYGDVISNHVVDAIGDMSGGVRLHIPCEQQKGPDSD